MMDKPAELSSSQLEKLKALETKNEGENCNNLTSNQCSPSNSLKRSISQVLDETKSTENTNTIVEDQSLDNTKILKKF
jgi:hypothetical protein